MSENQPKMIFDYHPIPELDGEYCMEMSLQDFSKMVNKMSEYFEEEATIVIEGTHDGAVVAGVQYQREETPEEVKKRLERVRKIKEAREEKEAQEKALLRQLREKYPNE